MNSTSSSDQSINRFHWTPDSSLIARVLSARCTATPGTAAPVGESEDEIVANGLRSGDCSRSSTSSIVTCNSDANAHSVRTEG